MVTGEFCFDQKVARPPFDAGKQVAAAAFAFVEIALRKSGSTKQPPVIRDGRAVERGIPAQIVCAADGVIRVQSLPAFKRSSDR